MKKKTMILLIFVCIIIVIIVIRMLQNPLFLRSERQIERYILRITPIGMSVEDVINVVRNETSWKVIRARGWTPLSSLSENELNSYIDERIDVGVVMLFLGKSFGFNSVTAIWRFNQNGELISVTVNRVMAI
jgi:hypothetical protein